MRRNDKPWRRNTSRSFSRKPKEGRSKSSNRSHKRDTGGGRNKSNNHRKRQNSSSNEVINSVHITSYKFKDTYDAICEGTSSSADITSNEFIMNY